MKNHKRNDRKKRIGIVTGASGGFGKEFIKLLQKEKNVDEIWAVARDEKKLQSLQKDEKKGGKKVKIYSVDLCDKEELKAFGDKIQKSNAKITFLINNAGYGKFCSYEELNVEDTVNMIDLNCNAVVAMTLFCIPHMERGSHIINVSSQSAFQPLPYLNVYGATKVFVRHYSRALNIELKEKGITVTAVCPGWMKTAFFERADIGAKNSVNQYKGIAEPRKVAAKAMRDAKRGKDMSVYSIWVKGCHLGAKLLPQKLVMKVWLKQQNF